VEDVTTAQQGGQELEGSDLPLNTSGVRGMEVTPGQLRRAGVTLSGVAVRRLEELVSAPAVTREYEQGGLVEALLALGVGVEPTVRGAVANHTYTRLVPPYQPLENSDGLDHRDG
jgi:hypothetical protein